MSPTVRRLVQRLVVVGASTAVIAGVALPLTTGVANAASGDTATAVTLSPHGAKDTMGDCTPYKATVSPSTGTFDVQLSGTAEPGGWGIVGFCDISGYSTTEFPDQASPAITVYPGGGAHSVTVSNGNDYDVNGNLAYVCYDENTASGVTTPDSFSCSAQFQATGGVVSFGVFDDQYNPNNDGDRTSLASVSLGITAYNDVNVNNVFESGIDTSLDSTSETWWANQASSIACTPASQNADADGTASYTCTPMTAGGTPYSGYFDNAYEIDWGTLRLVVASGPDKTESAGCSLAPVTDSSGNDTVTASGGEATSWTCTVDNSVSGGIAGTDSVTTYADNNDNSVLDSGEPSTSVSVTFILPAPSGIVVTISCAANQGDTTTENCELPTNSPTATFTGTVKLPDNYPIANALVHFEAEDGSTVGVNGSFNPASCITGADGTCTTKYTVTNPTDVVGSGDDSPDWVEVYDYVQTVVSKPSARPAAAKPAFVEGDYAASYDAGANPDGYAFVEWHNPYPDEARNVTVTPVSAGQPSGGAQDLVATVTDRFGDPVAGACVGWATTGPGEITSPPNLTGATYCVPEPDGAYAELDNGGASTFYDYECATNASGQCGVQVGSGPAEAGAETVTADIANYTNENNWINTSVGGQGGPDLAPRIAENAAEEAAQECSLPANATYGDGYDAGDGFDNGDGNNEGEFASLADLQDTSALAGHTPYYLDGGAENHFAETDGAFAIPHVTAGNCHASSTVVWQLPGTTNADHITISPTATTIGTNGDRMFTATVRDSSSSPVSGATVTFIQSGPGSFAGSSSITAITDASGHASAVLSTGSAVGSGTVTASISSATTGCSGTGCFATSHYGVKQVITASLLCTSPRPHVVKCVAKVRPHIAGLTVVFRHKVRGHYKRWGTATTNARGRAKLVKDNLTTGKTERVKAHVRSSDATLGATAGPASVTVT